MNIIFSPRKKNFMVVSDEKKLIDAHYKNLIENTGDTQM